MIVAKVGTGGSEGIEVHGRDRNKLHLDNLCDDTRIRWRRPGERKWRVAILRGFAGDDMPMLEEWE